MRRPHLRKKKVTVFDAYGCEYEVWQFPRTRRERKRDRIQYLVLCYEDRAYGGPEEGGWYYDAGYRIGPVMATCTEGTSYHQNAARLHGHLQRGVLYPEHRFRWLDRHEMRRGFPMERPVYC